jgi:hypothetical protein
MSNWRERLHCGIMRREWFRAEADEVVNAVTLVLIAASVRWRCWDRWSFSQQAWPSEMPIAALRQAQRIESWGRRLVGGSRGSFAPDSPDGVGHLNEPVRVPLGYAVRLESIWGLADPSGGRGLDPAPADSFGALGA